MNKPNNLFLPAISAGIHILPFREENDFLCSLDFTAANTDLTDDVLERPDLFDQYVEEQIRNSGARYGIGGYAEHRTVYKTSALFDGREEPRRFHIGTDIWAPAGTPVTAVTDGVIESVQYNNRTGDYGGTVILKHPAADETFYTLYGHLSLTSLENKVKGQTMPAGTVIAWLGNRNENGGWPPHLHFQLICDLQGWEGDYPGVCAFSEKEKYLANCPDPDLLLHWNRFIRKG